MELEKNAMIISGLLMPGLGQWLLGRRARGAAIMLCVVSLILLLMARVTYVYYQILFPLGQITRLEPADILGRMLSRAWAENWWLLAIISIIWIANVIDAYFLEKRFLAKKYGLGEESSP